MNSVVTTLKGKFGPLPVWVYIVLLIGGVIVYIKRKSAAAPTDDSGSASDATAANTLDTSNLVNPVPSYGVTYINVQQPTGTTTPPPATTTTPPPATTTTPPPATTTTPPPANTTTPTPPPKAKSITYVVKSGDTLTGIASKEKVPLSTLEATNKTVITNTAKQHGYTSDFNHWIFPGEKLVVPA